ncbi:hypothetical protein M1545_03440 [Patescibacteria group bacterium]|nr:hypothetical protein [Patescibacteria group bacterium]
MNKIKKTKVVIGLFIFIVFVATVSYLLTVNQERVPLTPVPSPNIPISVKGEYPIEFNVDRQDFNFSQRATVDTKERRPLDKDFLSAIAQKLGFSSEPFIANDIEDGETHIYRSASAGLVAYIEKGIIRYSLHSFPAGVNKNLTDEEIKNIANDFLTENGFTKDSEYQPSSLAFLAQRAGEGLYDVPKNEAAFYQVNFEPGGTDLPILTLNPENSSSYVHVLPDGNIFAAVIELYSVKKGLITYPLKNYDQVASEVGSSVLVSLDEGNINLTDLPEGAVTSVNISEISLSYLSDTSDNLTPIFILNGVAKVEGFDNDLKASLYLPALSP